MNKPLLSDLAAQLTPISDTPALDASVLIAHIINQPRTWVMAHPELALSSEQQRQLDLSLARLDGGESFPYVLGHWEFFGMEFEITPDVLIPRPETELLVEKAIVWLQESHEGKTVADIGTGSGTIAVSIAMNVADTHILATDISKKALEVARKNARKFKVDKQIEFFECDLLPANSSLINGSPQIDLICANLPYIPTDTLLHLPIFGREPTLALDGGADGLNLIRRLLSTAPGRLASHGMMLLEIESSRASQSLDLAHATFPEARIDLFQDLARQDRLLSIKL